MVFMGLMYRYAHLLSRKKPKIRGIHLNPAVSPLQIAKESVMCAPTAPWAGHSTVGAKFT